jgi:hypothetical protein
MTVIPDRQFPPANQRADYDQDRRGDDHGNFNDHLSTEEFRRDPSDPRWGDPLGGRNQGGWDPRWGGPMPGGPNQPGWGPFPPWGGLNPGGPNQGGWEPPWGGSNPGGPNQGGWDPHWGGPEPRWGGPNPGGPNQGCGASGPSNGCGSSGGLTVNGNTVNTGRYTITASQANGGTLTIKDNQTGKSTTVYGDPHILTDKGDTANFQHQPVTFALPDGTRITIDPTNNPGSVEYINNVSITKGDNAVEMSGFHQGTLQTQFERGAARREDAQHAPGTIITTVNGQIDQLQVLGGPAISGNSNPDLDGYANGGQGSGGQGNGSCSIRTGDLFRFRPHDGQNGHGHQHDYGHHHDHRHGVPRAAQFVSELDDNIENNIRNDVKDYPYYG